MHITLVAFNIKNIELKLIYKGSWGIFYYLGFSNLQFHFRTYAYYDTILRISEINPVYVFKSDDDDNNTT